MLPSLKSLHLLGLLCVLLRTPGTDGIKKPPLVVEGFTPLLCIGQGMHPIKRHDVAWTVYATVQNAGQSPIHVVGRMLQCCEDIGTVENDCGSIRMMGGSMGMLGPALCKNVTFVFPNMGSVIMTKNPNGFVWRSVVRKISSGLLDQRTRFLIQYLYNRKGECSVEVWFKDLMNNTNSIDVVLQFDTCVRRGHVPKPLKDWPLSDLEKLELHKCESHDGDPLDSCRPVDCHKKYNGAKNYFSKYKNLCVCNPTCYADPDKELPDVAYLPTCNECRDMERPILEEDLDSLLRLPSGKRPQKVLKCHEKDILDQEYRNIRCHHGKLNKESLQCDCELGWTSAPIPEDVFLSSTLHFHFCTVRTPPDRIFNLAPLVNAFRLTLTLRTISASLVSAGIVAVLLLVLIYICTRGDGGEDGDGSSSKKSESKKSEAKKSEGGKSVMFLFTDAESAESDDPEAISSDNEEKTISTVIISPPRIPDHNHSLLDERRPMSSGFETTGHFSKLKPSRSAALSGGFAMPVFPKLPLKGILRKPSAYPLHARGFVENEVQSIPRVKRHRSGGGLNSMTRTDGPSSHPAQGSSSCGSTSTESSSSGSRVTMVGLRFGQSGETVKDGRIRSDQHQRSLASNLSSDTSSDGATRRRIPPPQNIRKEWTHSLSHNSRATTKKFVQIKPLKKSQVSLFEVKKEVRNPLIGINKRTKNSLIPVLKTMQKDIIKLLKPIGNISETKNKDFSAPTQDISRTLEKIVSTHRSQTISDKNSAVEITEKEKDSKISSGAQESSKLQSKSVGGSARAKMTYKKGNCKIRNDQIIETCKSATENIYKFVKYIPGQEPKLKIEDIVRAFSRKPKYEKWKKLFEENGADVDSNFLKKQYRIIRRFEKVIVALTNFRNGWPPTTRRIRKPRKRRQEEEEDYLVVFARGRGELKRYRLLADNFLRLYEALGPAGDRQLLLDELQGQGPPFDPRAFPTRGLLRLSGRSWSPRELVASLLHFGLQGYYRHVFMVAGESAKLDALERYASAIASLKFQKTLRIQKPGGGSGETSRLYDYLVNNVIQLPGSVRRASVTFQLPYLFILWRALLYLESEASLDSFSFCRALNFLSTVSHLRMIPTAKEGCADLNRTKDIFTDFFSVQQNKKCLCLPFRLVEILVKNLATVKKRQIIVKLVNQQLKNVSYSLSLHKNQPKVNNVVNQLKRDLDNAVNRYHDTMNEFDFS